jgi:carbon-monoxide dehydrogenase medium subunit
MNDLAGHPAVRARFPALASCCSEVGAWPLRNRATVAGNLCNASPAADSAAALVALGAILRVAGPAGEREVPVEALSTGPGATVLAEGELAVEVVLPAAGSGWEASYQRISRRRGMDLATAGALVARRGASWRVVLVAVAPTVLRVPAAERILAERGPAANAAAKEAAIAACQPITDLRGTAEYRRRMVGVLVADGVRALAEGGR